MEGRVHFLFNNNSYLPLMLYLMLICKTAICLKDVVSFFVGLSKVKFFPLNSSIKSFFSLTYFWLLLLLLAWQVFKSTWLYCPRKLYKMIKVCLSLQKWKQIMSPLFENLFHSFYRFSCFCFSCFSLSPDVYLEIFYFS